jgi:hypothetical protein
MGQQGQGPRLALNLADQQLDQTGFEQQAGLVSRPLDGRPQVGLTHGTQQVETRLDEADKGGVGGQLPQPVGPQRHHQRGALGMRHQGGDEAGPLVRVAAQGERLLALIDHQHRGRTRRWQGREGIGGVGAGGDHHHPAAIAAERGRHPGPH